MVTFHLGFLFFSIAAILFADKQGFAYLTGEKQVLSKSTLQVIHYAVWIGLLGMIATGAYMAYPLRVYLLSDTIFIVKMLFVGILITNAFLIDSLMKVAHERPFASLTMSERIPLFLSGGISTIAWIGAATMGLLLF